MANSSNPETFPGWLDTIIGAGSFLAYNTPPLDGYGIAKLRGSGGATWASNFAQFLEILNAGDVIEVEWRMKWDGVRPNGATPEVSMDIFDDANNYMGFYFGAVGNWFRRYQQAGAARVNVDTGIVPVGGPGNMNRFRLRHDINGGEWFINDVSMGTWTTVGQIFANNQFYVRMRIDSTAQVECMYDWVWAKMTTTTTRNP
jgi:hypothetical protein